MGGCLGKIGCDEDPPPWPVSGLVCHENGTTGSAGDALDGRADEDVAQKLAAMRAHDNQIGRAGARLFGDHTKSMAGRDDHLGSLGSSKLLCLCCQVILDPPDLGIHSAAKQIVLDNTEHTKPGLMIPRQLDPRLTAGCERDERSEATRMDFSMGCMACGKCPGS
ncbi:MAG: hypothetical protein M5U35_10545 [Roseovarius sp.]|nr:hypothetical protein [Roseovarius sp.]